MNSHEKKNSKRIVLLFESFSFEGLFCLLLYFNFLMDFEMHLTCLFVIPGRF